LSLLGRDEKWAILSGCLQLLKFEVSDIEFKNKRRVFEGDFCRGFPNTRTVEDCDHFKDIVPYQSFAGSSAASCLKKFLLGKLT